MPYQQILPQPVSSFYRGKAMRAAAGEAEQSSRMNELAIEHATMENEQMRNPGVDQKEQVQLFKDFAEVGRDMEARNLAQYESETENLGPEAAAAKADERFQRDRRVMKRMFPQFQPNDNAVWSKDGAVGAISTAETVLARLKPPDQDAPKVQEFKEGDKIITRQWDKTKGMWIDMATAPRSDGVTVNVGGTTETAASKAFGEEEGKAFSAVLENGRLASDKAASLRAMKDNPAVTGPTQDLKGAATALFSDLGVPVSPDRIAQVSNLQQYKGIANQLVLAEQLKQKGPQTESDAKRIAESFGKTTNIQEANRMIVNYQLAIADREAVLAQIADDHRQRTGKVDGWRDEVRKYVRETPLAGYNPKSGRLVFWNEYADAIREHNPSMSEEDIMSSWRKTYAAR